MTYNNRQEAILTILKQKKRQSIDSLCQALFCSKSTIRRDLIALENAGLVKRFHGGVSLVLKNNAEMPYLYRETEHIAEKNYIASLAADFIGDNMSIFIDSSSTAFYLCQHLAQHNHLIVITNGLMNAISLAKLANVQVYMPGGEVLANSSSIVGEFSEQFIHNFKADICFLSCRGLDTVGIYEAKLNQALFKRKLIANAKQTILLCDHSKFDSSHVFTLTDFAAIDTLITDRDVSSEYQQIFAQHHTELLY